MKFRNIFWGIILILIGVLFTLENLNIIDFDWYNLWRLWPVVLILWGVSILPVKSIFRIILVLLVLAFSILYMMDRTVEWCDEDYDISYYQDAKPANQEFIIPYEDSVQVASLDMEIAASTFVLLDESFDLIDFHKRGSVIDYKYSVKQTDNSVDVDSIIESKLYKGLKQFYKKPITYKEFSSDVDDKSVGKLSSQKVGPTIADDIKNKAKLAVTLALIIIFVYVGARFRKWQFGVGGVITLIHDALIAMSLYSVFYGIVPFTLEVDQSFIAAILTIIGYSINDSVVIFDRIREYNHIYPKRELKSNINGAVNSTLGRTFNTSVTTFFTLLIIFIFGGEIIRGFSFALMVGVIIGTYSSIFVSTPVAYDFMMMSKKSKELEQKKK